MNNTINCTENDKKSNENRFRSYIIGLLLSEGQANFETNEIDLNVCDLDDYDKNQLLYEFCLGDLEDEWQQAKQSKDAFNMIFERYAHEFQEIFNNYSPDAFFKLMLEYDFKSVQDKVNGEVKWYCT